MAHDRNPERHAAACHFCQKMGCALGAIDRFAYPGLPGEVQRLWWKAPSRGRQARRVPENASFQRRLLLPSVFCDGGKLARITEAEAR
jgi:hypothetical protein